MKKIFGIAIICVAAFSQSFPNLSTQIFGSLKYELATDSYEYSHTATMHLYFSIKNISGSTVDFYCPSPNLSKHRVVLRDHLVGEFPLISLPVIRNVSLPPGATTADTLVWNTTPATEDTIYRLWGKLNSGGGFTADSLFVEFSFEPTNIIEPPERRETRWFAPNPVKRVASFYGTGSYKIFDLNGKLIARTTPPGTIDLSVYPCGTYLVKKAGSSECRKLLLMK